MAGDEHEPSIKNKQADTSNCAAPCAEPDMHTYTASSEFNPVINTKPFGVKETSPGRLLTGCLYLSIYILDLDRGFRY
jgi:hypothetical protein